MADRISSKDFEMLVSKLGRLSEKNIVAARKVMVEGLKQIDVARELGVSRQSINGVIVRIKSLIAKDLAVMPRKDKDALNFLSYGRMTAEIFNGLRPRLEGLTDADVEAGRLVLVKGFTREVAAAQTGIDRQTIGTIIRVIRRAAMEAHNEWHRVELWLPFPMAVQVEAMAARLRATEVAMEAGEADGITDHDIALTGVLNGVVPGSLEDLQTFVAGMSIEDLVEHGSPADIAKASDGLNYTMVRKKEFWYACVNIPAMDFNKEVLPPGMQHDLPHGAVGIRVDDNFFVVALLPWRFRDLSTKDIVSVLWPSVQNPQIFPDEMAVVETSQLPPS